MNTLFLLMAQYNGLAIVPLERVCNDYFQHLTPARSTCRSRGLREARKRQRGYTCRI